MATPAQKFLSASRFAVVGASRNKAKFGYRVTKWYADRKLPVTPINPRETDIDGIPCVKSLSDLADAQHTSVSIITPPEVTESVVDEAIRLGIPSLWFQPGSESAAAVSKARAAGLNVLANGPCILVDGPPSLKILSKY